MKRVDPSKILFEFWLRDSFTADDYQLAEQVQYQDRDEESKKKWQLFIDDTGLYYRERHVTQANLPISGIHPIYLTRNHKVMELLILDQQLKGFHSGVAHTLTQLQQIILHSKSEENSKICHFEVKQGIQAMVSKTYCLKPIFLRWTVTTLTSFLLHWSRLYGSSECKSK